MFTERLEVQVDVSAVEFTLGLVRAAGRSRSLTVGEAEVRNGATIRQIYGRTEVTNCRKCSVTSDADVLEVVLHLTVGARNRQEVGQVTGVLRNVAATTKVEVLNRTSKTLAVFDRVRIVVTTRRAGRVEHRELEVVTVDRIRVELDAPERIVLLVVDRETRVQADRGRFRFAEFDEAVEEQTILDDRAAQFGNCRVRIGFVACTIGRVRAADAESRISRIVVRTAGEVLAFRAQEVRFPVQVQCSSELVTTRLRDGIDDTTGRTAEFSRVTARLDFDRTVEFERNTSRTEIVIEVRDVQAVEVVGVFSNRRTADRGEVAECRVTLGRARCEQHDRREVAADRNGLGEFFNVDVEAGRGAAEVADDARTGNDDCRTRLRHRDFDGRGLRTEDRNARAGEVIVTTSIDDDVVVADRKSGNAEATVCSRSGRTADAGIVRGYGHGCAADGSAALIGHLARNSAGRIVLCGSRCDRNGTRSNASAEKRNSLQCGPRSQHPFAKIASCHWLYSPFVRA